MKRHFFLALILTVFLAVPAWAIPPLPPSGSTGNLSAGTMGGAGKVCTEASGTVIDCNSGPYQVTLTNPVTGPASPTASKPTCWDSAGNLLKDCANLTDTAPGGSTTIAGTGLTVGQAYYMSGSALAAADATSSATLPSPAICVATTTTACTFSGTLTTTGLTKGAVYYVPVATGGGTLTATIPALTGNQIQRIGVALSTTTLLIMPSLDVGVHQDFPSTSDSAPTNMTTDALPSPFVAAASAEYGGREAYHAFSASSTEALISGTTGWVSIDLGSGNGISILKYVIGVSGDTYATRSPNSWTFEGSNNNSSWTTLDTQTGQVAWQAFELRPFTLSAPTASYRYFRINVTVNNGDANYLMIGKILLFQPL